MFFACLDYSSSTRPTPGQKSQKKLPGKSRQPTPRVRKVIQAMVYESLSRAEAAAKVGMTDEALRVAFKTPQVIAAYNQECEALRTSLKAKAIHSQKDLMEGADSERVRLEASKCLDGREKSGMAPITVSTQINVTPGYVIDLSEHPEDIDQTGTENRPGI